MKNNLFYRLALFILAFQLPVLLVSAQDLVGTLNFKTGSTTASIKCLGFSYTMKGAQSNSSGAGAGKASLGDVVIQKAADNYTVTLQQILISGENLPTVTLELFKQDNAGKEELAQTITMTNVTVSQITHYGGISVPAKSTGTSPVEEITFIAQKIDFGTSPAATTSVPAGNKIQGSYNLKENKKQ